MIHVVVLEERRGRGRCTGLLGLPELSTTGCVAYTTEMHFSQFWRLEVLDQDGGRMVSPEDSLFSCVLTWSFLCLSVS